MLRSITLTTAISSKSHVPQFFLTLILALGQAAASVSTQPAEPQNDGLRVLDVCTCFTRGTLIRVHPQTNGAILKGTSYYKAIEKMAVGDLVLSWNEKTGVLGYEPVQQTFIRQADKIYVIRYADGTTVETTWSHPFYVAGKGWVDAKDLRAGMKSPTATAIAKHNERMAMAGGLKLPVQMVSYTRPATALAEARVELGTDLPGAVEIASIDVQERKEEVYNFDVAMADSYFVGEAGMLVHNGDYFESELWAKHEYILTNYQKSLSTLQERYLNGDLKGKSEIYAQLKEAIEAECNRVNDSCAKWNALPRSEQARQIEKARAERDWYENRAHLYTDAEIKGYQDQGLILVTPELAREAANTFQNQNKDRTKVHLYGDETDLTGAYLPGLEEMENRSGLAGGKLLSYVNGEGKTIYRYRAAGQGSDSNFVDMDNLRIRENQFDVSRSYYHNDGQVAFDIFAQRGTPFSILQADGGAQISKISQDVKGGTVVTVDVNHLGQKIQYEFRHSLDLHSSAAKPAAAKVSTSVPLQPGQIFGFVDTTGNHAAGPAGNGAVWAPNSHTHLVVKKYDEEKRKYIPYNPPVTNGKAEIPIWMQETLGIKAETLPAVK